MGHLAAAGLPLLTHNGLEGGVSYFTLAGAHDLRQGLPWLICQDPKDYLVLPCAAQSPAQVYLAAGRKIPGYLGLALKQTGDEETLLEHAAKHAFFEW